MPKNVLALDVSAVHFQYLDAHYDNWQVPQDIESKGFVLSAIATNQAVARSNRAGRAILVGSLSGYSESCSRFLF